VDDEPYNTIITEGLLLRLNIRAVDKAFNGTSALNKIIQNSSYSSLACPDHKAYSHILMDYNMPMMDGA